MLTRPQPVELKLSHLTGNVTGIFGVAGSGRTNTAVTIIEQLVEQNIPFTAINLGFQNMWLTGNDLPYNFKGIAIEHRHRSTLYATEYHQNDLTSNNLAITPMPQTDAENNDGWLHISDSEVSKEFQSARAEWLAIQAAFTRNSVLIQQGMAHKDGYDAVSAFFVEFLQQLPEKLKQRAENFDEGQFQPYYLLIDEVPPTLASTIEQLAMVATEINLHIVYIQHGLHSATISETLLAHTDNFLFHRIDYWFDAEAGSYKQALKENLVIRASALNLAFPKNRLAVGEVLFFPQNGQPFLATVKHTVWAKRINQKYDLHLQELPLTETERLARQKWIEEQVATYKFNPTRLERFFAKFIKFYRVALIALVVVAVPLHFANWLDLTLLKQSARLWGVVVPPFSIALLVVQGEKIFAWRERLQTEKDAITKLAIHKEIDTDIQEVFKTISVLIFFGLYLIIVPN